MGRGGAEARVGRAFRVTRATASECGRAWKWILAKARPACRATPGGPIHSGFSPPGNGHGGGTARPRRRKPGRERETRLISSADGARGETAPSISTALLPNPPHREEGHPGRRSPHPLGRPLAGEHLARPARRRQATRLISNRCTTQTRQSFRTGVLALQALGQNPMPFANPVPCRWIAPYLAFSGRRAGPLPGAKRRRDRHSPRETPFERFRP